MRPATNVLATYIGIFQDEGMRATYFYCVVIIAAVCNVLIHNVLTTDTTISQPVLLTENNAPM